ncbi:MAG: DMT family transporter [Oscillospiraceae bacterium]|nr:DMT family transporter [Oscillospiraceae bacterium]
MTNQKKARNCLLLLITAAIWGMAFVSQQAGMDYMGPLTFNGSRNIIGSIVLIPVILMIRGRVPKAERRPLPVKTTIIGGLACGAALTAASTLQQYGLTMTTVGKGGFITTLYIILTPIFGIFIGKKAPKAVWFCALLAVGGMYLLCVSNESFSVSTGDLLVLASSAVFAVHILVIDHFSPLTDGVILSCIQFAVCGVISTIGAFIFEQPSWEQLISGAVPVLYAGVLSCGVGYTLQIVGQKGVDPTAAALILSLESVVATISGFIAYKIGFLKTDQSMTIRQIAGCAVVFAAVILVQLPWDRISEKLRKKPR